MPGRELLVLWRVFEHCNLGCSFCGYSRHLVRPRTTADVRTLLHFGAILGEFANRHERGVTVSWLGGEPLLWPALMEVSATFQRQFDLRLSVTTNGLPLGNPKIRESLIEHYDHVTVSIDGIGAVHDGYRDMPGLFDRVREAVVALREEADAANRPLTIGVNTILMRGNVEGFEALCREVAEWGVGELTFNQLGGNDRPEFYPANRLLPEQIEGFMLALPGTRSKLKPLGLAIRGSARYLERIAATAKGERWAVGECGPGESFLFIDERGRIAPCSFTAADYGIHVDEIQTPDDLANLPERFRELRQRRAAACDDCHSTQVFQKFALPLC
jgi:MoaA/NifB/PqqE/SkfB family radical SAM enzyme